MLAEPVGPDYETGRPVGTQSEKVAWSFDAGLQRDHVPALDRPRYPAVVGADGEELADQVMVDGAVGVGEDDLVALLYRREVEALVEALAAGPTEPVTSYVSVSSPFPRETRIR